MTDGIPQLSLRSGDSVFRSDGKEFIVDERRGAQVLFKARSPDDPELFLADDLELAAMFSEARLVHALDRGRNTSPRVLLDQFRAGFRHVPEKYKAIVEKRLSYALALRELPRGQRSGATVEKHLDELAVRRGDSHRPSTRMVRSWRRRLVSCDYDPTALLPHHAVPRTREKKLDPHVQEAIEWAIDTFYMTPARWTAVRVYQELCAGLKRYAERFPEYRDRLRVPPSIAALRRAIKARDPYYVMAARYGKHAADRHFRITKKGRVYERPLEAVIVDATKLDLFVIDDDGTTRDRPWLITVTCATTRMPTGFSLMIESPSAATVLQGLRNSMAPKSYVAELYPHIRRSWPCHGKPEEVIFDVGRENFNKNVPRALREIFADVEFTAVDAPYQKGRGERFFGTINTQLIHMLEGTTRSNPRDLYKGGKRGKLDPVKLARYTLEQVRAKLHQYFIEDYPYRFHRELGCKPIDAWREAVAKHGVRPPPPDAQLALLMSKTEQRELQPYGIHLFGIIYTSEDLGRLRPRNIDTHSVTITVKYDPSDIGKVWVLDKDRREYVPAYPEGLGDLLRGMTERQFNRIREKILERKKEEEITAEDYYETTCELFVELRQRPRVKSGILRTSKIERSPLMPYGRTTGAKPPPAPGPDPLDDEPEPQNTGSPDGGDEMTLHPIMDRHDAGQRADDSKDEPAFTTRLAEEGWEPAPGIAPAEPEKPAQNSADGQAAMPASNPPSGAPESKPSDSRADSTNDSTVAKPPSQSHEQNQRDSGPAMKVWREK